MSRSGRPFRVARVLGPLLAALACDAPGGVAPDPVWVDLLERFPLARARTESPSIDLGTPGARAFLERGWSIDERHGAATVVWSDGPESVLDFWLDEPRSLVMALRGRAFVYADAPAQRVAVAVNGTAVGAVELGPSMAAHRLAVPGSALRRGSNRVRFRYAYARPPKEVVPGAGDVRALGVLWDRLDFTTPDGAPLGGGGVPRLAQGAPELVLPSGSSLEYTLALAPDAVLAIESLVPAGAGGPGAGSPLRLEIRLERDGAPPRRLASLEGAGGPYEIEVHGSPSEVARLALRCVGGGAPGAEVRLRRPRILSGRSPATRDRRPDIVLYVVDTLRRDQLGSYGGPAGLTPSLDRFAADALVFERALAQSSWTRTSMGSLVTGLAPGRHGANDTADRLSEDLVTLAERLLAQGYETAGFTANPLVDQTFGFDQGFLEFQAVAGESDYLARSELVHERALAWLDARPGSRPFFLYLHTMDPHEPYDPPPAQRARWARPGTPAEVGQVPWLQRLREGAIEPSPETRDRVRSLYAGEVAANDARFGQWWAAMAARGLAGGALWIVVSDHGEAFHEHGHFGHRHGLYDELLQVPMIWRLPGGARAGERSRRLAQHLDIVPSVLDALDIEPPPGLPGRSLLEGPSSEAAGPGAERGALAVLRTGPLDWTSFSDGRWKLIRTRRDGRDPVLELYDLASDPGERTDLAARRPGKVAELLARIEAADREAAGAAAPSVEMDASLRRRLEALGYAE
ncbi:MAG: sulfatase-like hydrolase/transferase [Myxococcota bacterium]